MLIVYHPVQWSAQWPKGAKPYATKELAIAHGHAAVDIIETPFTGPIDQIENEPPVLTQEEQEFVAENPGAVVAAVVPEESTSEEPAAPAAQSVTQAPASVKPAKPSKKTQTKAKK